NVALGVSHRVLRAAAEVSHPGVGRVERFPVDPPFRRLWTWRKRIDHSRFSIRLRMGRSVGRQPPNKGSAVTAGPCHLIESIRDLPHSELEVGYVPGEKISLLAREAHHRATNPKTVQRIG